MGLKHHCYGEVKNRTGTSAEHQAGWDRDGRETKIIKEMIKYASVDVLITQYEVR